MSRQSKQLSVLFPMLAGQVFNWRVVAAGGVVFTAKPVWA
jgi:hypothetical protein